MSEQKPTTRKIAISEVRDQLATLANDVARREIRVVVEESGTPIAALVSVNDLERWSRLDQERDERLAVIDRMRAAFADVPPEEIEIEVAKALAEVRSEMAAEREKNALAS